MNNVRLNKALTFALVFVAIGIFVLGNVALLLLREAQPPYVGVWGLPIFMILGAVGFAFGWKRRNR